MKKFLFLTVLLLAIVACIQAQVDERFDLILEGFRVLPTEVGGYSYYDYMHGSYDGFPIRVQGDDIIDHGLYMTFMIQSSVNQNRRQKLAFIGLDGTIVADSDILAGTSQEGFGTLVLDHTTGNPFFAWHFNNGGAVLPSVHMVHDVYCYNYLPGTAISELMDINLNIRPENIPQHPSPLPIDRAEEFTFIWPVVKTGPSPLGNQFQRLYVFMSNSGKSWILARDGSYWPSSAIRMAYADFWFGWENDDYYYEYYFEGMHDDLIWTVKRIDYFERMHYFDNNGDTDHYVRTFPAYAVSEDGKVALAGYITGNEQREFIWERYDLSTISATSGPSLLPAYPNDGVWPGNPGEYYTHFVVINNNYGETPPGGATDGFHIHRMNYQKRWDPYHTLDYVHYADPNHPEGALEPWNYNVDTAGNIRYEEAHYYMSTQMVNHQTITFDGYGRLHIPTAFDVVFTTFTEPGVIVIPPWQDLTGDQDWKVWIGAEIVYRIVYHPATDNTRLDRVHPHPKRNVGEVSLPMDFDDDGVFDLEVCQWNEQGQLTRFFEGSLPYYHWDRENRFHNNQLKMSEPNENGVMVMMWIDSYNAYRGAGQPTPDPDYIQWATQDQIYVTLSDNNGETWSNILKMSSIETPGLAGTRPAFVYPADKVTNYIPEGAGTIYFMFTDDVEYGGNTSGDPIYGGPGAYVKVAAIDVTWEPQTHITGNKDIVGLKSSMLSQNYPNPFNPSTTISFDLPQTGKVNLSVYNIKGQLVRTIANDTFTQGRHEVKWLGTDNNNNPVASGVYFYKIEANGQQEIKKMVMLK